MPLVAPQELRTFFLTFATANRRRLFQVESKALLFVDIVQSYRIQKKFQLHAFVVMPDHVHLLLTPAFDISLEKAVQLIKGGYSFRLKSKLDVWERGYTNHRIINAADYQAHADYIEQNPVKAMRCAVAEEYEYSSAGKPETVDAMPAHFAKAQG